MNINTANKNTAANKDLGTPLVSIYMITYNHVDFIRQALDSVLMQKVDFHYEICIGEDDSSDGTKEICKEYAKKFPDIIRLFLRERNDPERKKYSAPFMLNFVETLKACRGEYIALLEGDDYWTDPLKLQKQVKILNENLQYSACFHNVLQKFQDEDKNPIDFHREKMKSVYKLRDIVSSFFIPTCSVLFRRKNIKNIPDLFLSVPIADWPLHILNAEKGDFFYINDCMAVYRIHNKSYWSSKDITRYIKTISCIETMNSYLNNKFKKEMNKLLMLFCRIVAAKKIKRGEYISSLQYFFKYILYSFNYILLSFS